MCTESEVKQVFTFLSLGECCFGFLEKRAAVMHFPAWLEVGFCFFMRL